MDVTSLERLRRDFLRRLDATPLTPTTRVRLVARGTDKAGNPVPPGTVDVTPERRPRSRMAPESVPFVKAGVAQEITAFINYVQAHGVFPVRAGGGEPARQIVPHGIELTITEPAG